MESIKKIVGFTAGNFDLLHPGYIYTFEDAKKHCDHFIVFLHADPSAYNRNKYKPVIPLYERYRALMSIQYIDEVFIYKTEDELLGLIEHFKPDLRVLGDAPKTESKTFEITTRFYPVERTLQIEARNQNKT